MAISAAVFLCGCRRPPPPPETVLSGRTMGTTYLVRIAGVRLSPEDDRQLQSELEALLAELNRQMSLYQPDSELAQFNRTEPEVTLKISPEFRHVLRRALEVAEKTDGAFDPTLGALINVWGFGPAGPRKSPPTAEEIAAARQCCGWRKISLSPDGHVSKSQAGLQLDLGAIAKGFAVDAVADFLRRRGFSHFLVEIGGEVAVAGQNAAGEPWRIGLVCPDPTPEPPALYRLLHLADGQAIATSGDYRQFFRDSTGQIHAHILDPRTGEPVRHSVASVSVRAGDCLTADALATALFVLGPEDGLRLLAGQFPDCHALFLLRTGIGEFQEISSPGW